MTTYSVREFKSRVSEILRSLNDGEEVTITRRGKPCARVTPVNPAAERKPSLGSLRGALTDLPDATYEDFLEIKSVWDVRTPAPPELKDHRAG